MVRILPKICSRGIQPSESIKLYQCFNTSILTRKLAKTSMNFHYVISVFQELTKSWWNPSSHKNPRGKKGREGTAVKRPVSCVYTGGSCPFCTIPLPQKYPIPPIRLLNAAVAHCICWLVNFWSFKLNAKSNFSLKVFWWDVIELAKSKNIVTLHLF